MTANTLPLTETIGPPEPKEPCHEWVPLHEGGFAWCCHGCILRESPPKFCPDCGSPLHADGTECAPYSVVERALANVVRREYGEDDGAWLDLYVTQAAAELAAEEGKGDTDE